MTTKTVTREDFQKLTDTLDRWRVSVQARQDKQEKTLYGDGDVVGLDERFRNHQAILAAHAEIMKDMHVFIESMKPIMLFYKVGVWFAGLIGVSVVSLIWGLITGSITMTIP